MIRTDKEPYFGRIFLSVRKTRDYQRYPELDGRNLTRFANRAKQNKPVISVMVRREGWDVQNVTTIVGLRPYTSFLDLAVDEQSSIGSEY